MSVEWKEIFDALMEGADDINILSYRLSDGSYIMAEEMDYDPNFDVLFLDLPVLIKQGRRGNISLEKWMFQPEFEEDIPAQPIELQCNKIVAKIEAPVSLKRDYLKYNFLDKLHGTFDEDEFQTILDEIHSYDLDKKDSSSDITIDPLMKAYLKRLKYPDKN
tara:strand:- start:20643 stop:21128 length:486 start_codon:yes stop_codon:yes gene_type:complete